MVQPKLLLPMILAPGLAAACVSASAQATQMVSQQPPENLIAPTRPVPVGKAPAMQFKQVNSTPEEAVYAIIFSKGDEVMSGLTDFAIAHKITDAHFTAIGAVSSATLAWFDLDRKLYHPIPVNQQVEVLSLVGDIAAFNGKPIVHMHAVVGTEQGTTMGGHAFALVVNPTIEVFLTANTTPLAKKEDPSGLRLIDPTH